MTREQRKRRRRLIAIIVAIVLGGVCGFALVVSCNAYADGFTPRDGGETWLAVAAAVAFGVGTMKIAAWLDK